VRIALLVWVTTALGCVEVALRESFEPFDYEPVPVDGGPPSRTQGAVWPGRTPSGSFLFFDQKARSVGDLVTVNVVENVLAEESAATDLEKKSSMGATLTSDVGLQALVQKPIEFLLRAVGLGNVGVAVPDGTELNVLESNNTDKFEGDGKTRREGRFTATVTCRVLAVHPGPIFHVRGRRGIVVNHEMRYLTVEGLVRQLDIGIDNTVVSSALAEARITLDGIGVVDDKQRPGWLQRVFSWVYPL